MKNIFSLVILFMLLTGCGKGSKEIETEKQDVNSKLVKLTPAQAKNAGIKTTVLEQKPVYLTLKVNGIIEVPPQNMISVSAPLGGYLKTTKLLEGMAISKGEVIATMEDQQYIQLQQEYLTGRAKLTTIEKEYMRQKELNQSKASSDKVYENAEADFISQKVMVKSLYEKLKLIGIQPENLNEQTISRTVSVLSPITGYVSSVKANIGKYASPTDVLFELVNPEDIHLSLTVFEKDLSSLFIGQKVVAYSNHPESKKYDCEIILIGQNISMERAATVHCHFLKYDKSLLPGMYMNAEIQIPSDKSLVIQTDGVVQFEGKQYVFTQLNENQFAMEEVMVQNSTNGFTQIKLVNTRDLSREKFVTEGAYTLLMTLKNAAE